MSETELIEQAALRVGMKSLMNHGAASCVYSEGCNGVSQEHLIAFAREVALHCATALATPARAAEPQEQADAARWQYAMDWSNKEFAVCYRDEDAWTPMKTNGPIDAARNTQGETK